jgi:hypothetical protein
VDTVLPYVVWYGGACVCLFLLLLVIGAFVVMWLSSRRAD